MLRSCSNSTNTLAFIRAYITVSYSWGYIIHQMFLKQHGMEELVGDWDYPLVSTFLHSKSVKFASSLLPSEQQKCFLCSETIRWWAEKLLEVLKRWEGREKGGLSVDIATDHLLPGCRVVGWCCLAPRCLLASSGQDGDGWLGERNRAHGRFEVRWTFFLHGFLFLPAAVPA